MLPTPTTMSPGQQDLLDRGRPPARAACRALHRRSAGRTAPCRGRPATGVPCTGPSVRAMPEQRAEAARVGQSDEVRVEHDVDMIVPARGAAPSHAAIRARHPTCPGARSAFRARSCHSRYLPRRSSCSTRRPASRGRRSCGTGQRRRGIAHDHRSRPSVLRRYGASARRVTSTSGNSGIAIAPTVSGRCCRSDNVRFIPLAVRSCARAHSMLVFHHTLRRHRVASVSRS